MQAGSEDKLYERFLKMSNGYMLGSKYNNCSIENKYITINYYFRYWVI
jgi:hypothetical protein